jgi:hypothetical protein
MSTPDKDDMQTSSQDNVDHASSPVTETAGSDDTKGFEERIAGMSGDSKDAIADVRAPIVARVLPDFEKDTPDDDWLKGISHECIQAMQSLVAQLRDRGVEVQASQHSWGAIQVGDRMLHLRRGLRVSDGTKDDVFGNTMIDVLEGGDTGANILDYANPRIFLPTEVSLALGFLLGDDKHTEMYQYRR